MYPSLVNAAARTSGPSFDDGCDARRSYRMSISSARCSHPGPSRSEHRDPRGHRTHPGSRRRGIAQAGGTFEAAIADVAQLTLGLISAIAEHAYADGAHLRTELPGAATTGRTFKSTPHDAAALDV
jgi:hypothetical protein